MPSFKDFKPEIKTLFIVALVAVVISVAGILLFSSLDKSSGINPIASAQCRQLKQEIDIFIQQATYCEVDADCVVPKKHLSGSPPCDCLYAVNKNYTDSSELENAVQGWNTDCREDIVCGACAPLPTFAKCEQNQCVGGWNQDDSVLDISDWQTYRNEEFGFEVRYPKDWRDVTNEDINRVVPESKAYQFTNREVIFTISLRFDKATRDIFDMLLKAKAEKSFGVGGIIYTKLKDFTVHGLPAVKYSVDRSVIPAEFPPPGAVREEILLKKGEMTFSFFFIGESGAIKGNEVIFDQILATFRFTE